MISALRTAVSLPMDSTDTPLLRMVKVDRACPTAEEQRQRSDSMALSRAHASRHGFFSVAVRMNIPKGFDVLFLSSEQEKEKAVVTGS